MAPPRAGRSRKVVDESSEEGEIPTATTQRGITRQIPTRTKAPQARKSSVSSARPSPQTTPKKAKRTAKKSAETPTKTKPIFSFFNNATQTQRQNKPEQRSLPFHAAEDNAEAIEDSILDDISDDGTPKQAIPVKSKRPLDTPSEVPATNAAFPASRNMSKFLKRSDGSRGAATPQSTNDEQHDPRPWTERFAPTNFAELAVHKKKVGDVKSWLESSLSGQIPQRLLVLKGPAGCGKTSTVSLLSQALRYEINEWRNPGAAEFTGSNGYVSMSGQFEDFINRGSRFTGLTFADSAGIPVHDVQQQSTSPDRQILLVEEFPSLVNRSQSALSSFRSTLLQYLAANARMSSAFTPDSHSAPIVLVISESVLSNTESSAENFTAHRLLGSELIHHPGTRVIEFNPIAPTFLAKALSLVVDKQVRASGRQSFATRAVIDRLADLGDVRNAVSTLEFLQSHQSVALPASRRPPTLVKGKAKLASGPSDQTALDVISLRESNIGLFHAVGKIVYNKRQTAAASNISAGSKPPLDVDIDLLYSTTGTDVSTFLSGLHENYILSTHSRDTESLLDTINACLDSLCDADITAAVAQFGRAAYAGAANEGLRQEELAFYTGVCGMLDSLPYPVKRQSVAPPGSISDTKRRMEAAKMYFPTEIKLWTRREEMKSISESLVARALDGRLNSELDALLPPSRREISQPGRMPKNMADKKSSGLVLGYIGRREMLLERLPYVNMILPRSSSGSPLAAELKKMTTFTGYGRVDEDEDDEDPLVPLKGRRNNVLSGDDMGVDKLVLSDDDIEDE